MLRMVPPGLNYDEFTNTTHRTDALFDSQRYPVCLRIVCMATKRNALGVLMGIELILNAAKFELHRLWQPATDER